MLSIYAAGWKLNSSSDTWKRADILHLTFRVDFLLFCQMLTLLDWHCSSHLVSLWEDTAEGQTGGHTHTYTHTAGFFLPFFLLFLIKKLLERQVALVWRFYQKQKCWDKNKWVFFQNFSNHPFKSQTLISLCTNMNLIHASTHARLPITYTPKHLHPSEALKLTDSGRGISSWYAGGVRKPDGGRGFTKMAPKHSFSCVLHIMHYGSGCKCVCHIPKQPQQVSDV